MTMVMPLTDEGARLGKAGGPVFAEACVSELTVEALDLATLHRLARLADCNWTPVPSDHGNMALPLKSVPRLLWRPPLPVMAMFRRRQPPGGRPLPVSRLSERSLLWLPLRLWSLSARQSGGLLEVTAQGFVDRNTYMGLGNFRSPPKSACATAGPVNRCRR